MIGREEKLMALLVPAVFSQYDGRVCVGKENTEVGTQVYTE